jgi:predicted enzyme related to lactoylglutathione lyase
MLGQVKQVGFVGVTDLVVAQRFYGDVIGLDLVDARPFALVHDTSTSQLRITAVENVRPAPYTVLGWIVRDLEDEIDRLTEAGVTFNRYEGMVQDERGIWTTPDGSRVAWFHDPDGNNLSLQA